MTGPAHLHRGMCPGDHFFAMSKTDGVAYVCARAKSSRASGCPACAALDAAPLAGPKADAARLLVASPAQDAVDVATRPLDTTPVQTCVCGCGVCSRGYCVFCNRGCPRGTVADAARWFAENPEALETTVALGERGKEAMAIAKADAAPLAAGPPTGVQPNEFLRRENERLHSALAAMHRRAQAAESEAKSATERAAAAERRVSQLESAWDAMNADSGVSTDDEIAYLEGRAPDPWHAKCRAHAARWKAGASRLRRRLSNQSDELIHAFRRLKASDAIAIENAKCGMRHAERADAAETKAAHLQECWDTSCEHVKQALELLDVDVSVDGYVPDTWTLLDQCKATGRALRACETYLDGDPARRPAELAVIAAAVAYVKTWRGTGGEDVVAQLCAAVDALLALKSSP